MPSVEEHQALEQQVHKSIWIYVHAHVRESKYVIFLWHNIFWVHVHLTVTSLLSQARDTRIQFERVNHQLAEKELELENALTEASTKVHVHVIPGVGVDGISGWLLSQDILAQSLEDVKTELEDTRLVSHHLLPSWSLFSSICCLYVVPSTYSPFCLANQDEIGVSQAVTGLTGTTESKVEARMPSPPKGTCMTHLLILYCMYIASL